MYLEAAQVSQERRFQATYDNIEGREWWHTRGVHSMVWFFVWLSWPGCSWAIRAKAEEVSGER